MGYEDGIEKHLAGRRREREIKDLSSIMVNRFMLDIDIKTNTCYSYKTKIYDYRNTHLKKHKYTHKITRT